MNGAEWDGYTSREFTRDSKPVAEQFAGLWPAGTPGIGAAGGEHQQQTKTTVMYPGEGQGKKRKRKPRQAEDGGK